MLKLIILSLLIFLIFQGSLFPAADKIVAVVNDDVITSSELNSRLNLIILNLMNEFQGEDLQLRIDKAKEDILNVIIEDKIILQEAKRQGFSARQDAVKMRIEQIKNGFPSESDFQKTFKDKGLTENDLEKIVAEQIVMHAVIEKEIKDKIIISPEEVTEYYKKNIDKFSIPQKRAVEIFSTDDEDKAGEMMPELKKGVSSQKAAKDNDVTYAKETVSGLELSPEIQEEVFSLQKNEVSKQIKVGTTYYIFKLLKIIPGETLSLNAVHEKISGLIYQEKFAAELAAWLDDLKSKVYIEIK